MLLKQVVSPVQVSQVCKYRHERLAWPTNTPAHSTCKAQRSDAFQTKGPPKRQPFCYRIQESLVGNRKNVVADSLVKLRILDCILGERRALFHLEPP